MALGSVLGARTGAALAGVALALGVATVVAHSATRPEVAPAPPGVSSADPPDAPGRDGEDEGAAVGPDATGPAAFGLCRAWANHEKHDDDKARAKGSVAMRNLAEAAGGEDRVEAYCATVRHPGAGSQGKRRSSDVPGTRGGPKEWNEQKDEKDKKVKKDGKDGEDGKEERPGASPSPSRS